MNDTKIYDSDFSPMSIAELLDGQHHFLIPSFQRGYRWEEKQVCDLLEDIMQFANDDNVKSDSYFLQPIVVKSVRRSLSDSSEIEAYEVLDGQQRLTTLLLILKELLRGYMTSKDTSKYAPLLYDITYTNRPQLNFDDPTASDNIDSYYLREAYDVIATWCEENEDLTEIVRCLFYTTAKRKVKIIWYAIDSSSADLVSINIFNRLNKGKISLTSSELIKALFIMDYDLRADDDKLPAEQLSMERNEMERTFQNDSFWYFISDDKRGTQTRIDVLFDFVTCSNENNDSDYAYREFQRLYDHCRNQERNGTNEHFVCKWASDISNMQDAWLLVRKTFDRLISWHEDNMYYHYVGYLVSVGYSPLQIYNHLENKKNNRKQTLPSKEWTTDDTLTSLRQLIMERFRQNMVYIPKDAIDEFEYGSEYISRILLLFNVECYRKSQNHRFAFDKYKKESWDVEHIESQNDATLQEYDDRLRWLNNVKFVLDMEHTERAKELSTECQRLIEDFKTLSSGYSNKYYDFYHTINKFYAAEHGEIDTEIDLTTKKKDYLSNLTLLDSSTNREYKDAPFAYKRHCIVKYDKRGDRFIPLCTRNVFLKYYTDSNSESSYLDMMRWNSTDRTDYMKAIHEAVDPIFDSINQGKENKNE